MKKNTGSLILILIFSSILVFSQRQKEIFLGKIEYDIQDIRNNQINKKDSYELYFNDTLQRSNIDNNFSNIISNFKKNLSKNGDIDSLEIEWQTQAFIEELKNTTIYNYKVLNKNFSFKKLYKDEVFLVIDSVTKINNFEILSEVDTILGFICQKATAKGTFNKPVEIWFAADIKYSIGPYNWTGLPGAILKMKWNNGQSVIVAKKIELPLGKPIVDDLSKYKLLTEEAFDKIKLKSLKEILQK
jgi:GLPGLI family protein